MVRCLAEGEQDLLSLLRSFAADTRWRIREAVAMALQHLGDLDMQRLIDEMRLWGKGTPLEQRAAAAALCEPRLLARPEQVGVVLDILDDITSSIEKSESRKNAEFATLRKGMGYCWSVAVAAFPLEGKERMEKWLASADKDIRWIMKENLSKARLLRMDAKWVEKCREILAG